MNKLLYTYLPFTLFAVFAFVYLALTAQDLFFVSQSQDMFVYDELYFNTIAESPGFLAPYAGSFLTQFAYYPLLGILIFVLLLTGLSVLSAWAFKLPRKIFFIALLPALFLLMFVMRWDYGIFTFRHYGNLYSAILGLIASVTITGIYVRMKNSIARYVWQILTIVALYPFLGCFVLLSSLLSVLMDLLVLRRFNLVLTIVSVIVLIFTPIIEVRLFFISFNTVYMWEAGLPYLDFYEDSSQILPLYLSIVSVVCLPAYAMVVKTWNERWCAIVSVTCSVIVAACVVGCANKDSNFHTLIAAEHAYENGDTEKVLMLCTSQERPIRSLIMYRNIELYKRKELLDKMFQYTWAADTIVSKNESMNTMIVGPRVCEEYTFWNFSYRWAMERFVKYKPTYIDTKIMAKDCVYNKESALADKYLSKLEHTLFYSDWAESQRRLLDPKVIEEDSIYKLHAQLLVVPDGALDNTQFCEYMLLKHFQKVFVMTPERAILSLAAAMEAGNEELFWQVTLAEFKQHRDEPMPKHVQEAALLFAFKRNNPALMEQIKLMVGKDGSVCQQFERNQDLIARLLSQPTQQDVMTLRSICAGTYWSYYFYDLRQTTIYD